MKSSMNNIIVFFEILILIRILTLPKVKGFLGELANNIRLLLLDKKEYYLYKDVYIMKEDGTTSQIDHIIASRYGIFVIETKNFSGWIYGSENNKNWTQTTKKSKNTFLNPIIQNKGHIKALKNYLEIDNIDYYYSIIVFSLNATLKKIDTTTPVIHSVKLNNEIKKHMNQIINEKEFIYIINKLRAIEKTSPKQRKKHIEDINSKYKSDQ